jgi:hypothetical protein
MAQDFNLLAKRPREFHLQNAHQPPARPSLSLTLILRVFYLSLHHLWREPAQMKKV